MAEQMKQGDRVEVSELHGYVLEQNRPMACRTYGQYPDGSYGWGCKCGKCNGHTTQHHGVVTEVAYYADNSVEARVLCDDGVTRTEHLVAPHGDLC